MAKKPKMPETAAESVMLETLQLLQKTVDYLSRLSLVPVTRQLVNELQAHLDAPHVRAVQREAAALELEKSVRYGKIYSPSGLCTFQAVVDRGVVYVKAPPFSTEFEDHRLTLLHRGVEISIQPTPPAFFPWHSVDPE